MNEQIDAFPTMMLQTGNCENGIIFPYQKDPPASKHTSQPSERASESAAQRGRNEPMRCEDDY